MAGRIVWSKAGRDGLDQGQMGNPSERIPIRKEDILALVESDRLPAVMHHDLCGHDHSRPCGNNNDKL